MRKTILILTSFMAIASLFFACRKKPGPTPAPQKFTGCRVSQITEIGVDTSHHITYTFTYNNDGTVATITSYPDKADIFVTTITYNKNYIIAYTTDNSEALTKDSLVLNAQNKVIYIDHYDYNGSPPHQVYDQYQYDSAGNLKTIISYNNTNVSTQVFDWKNGDIIWNSSGNGFYTYVYDTGLYNTGNITARIADLVNYGISIYTPRHLRSMEIFENSDTATYAYTLDATGKLTTLQATETGNYTTTIQITYACE